MTKKFDKQKSVILRRNFSQTAQSVASLSKSHDKLSKFPALTGDLINELDDSTKDAWDAFRVRFCDVQDMIGGRIFRSLLDWEEEQFISQIDVINKMEKRKIIPSVQAWLNLRAIRNDFAHDYPDSNTDIAQNLNHALSQTPQLVTIFINAAQYVSSQDKELIREITTQFSKPDCL